MRRIVFVSVGWVGISMINDGLPAVLLPHQLMSAGDETASMLGLTTLVGISLAAAVQPLAGSWSDRIGRWPVIGLGVATTIVGLTLVVAPDTALLGAVVALIGVSIAQAGHQPLLADLVPSAARGRGAGLKGAFDVGGAFLGFLLLAAILAGGSSPGAALLLALAVGLPFGLAFLVLRTEPRRGLAETAPADALRADASRELAWLVLARFLFLLGIFAVGRFLLLFVADRLGLGADAAAQQAGTTLAILALLTAAASFPAGWLSDRIGRRSLMLAGGVLAGAGIGLLTTAASIQQVALFGALMALGTAAFGAASWAAQADLAPAPVAGRMLGLANIGTAGAAAAAGALGLLIDAGNRAQPGAGWVLALGLAAACTLAGGVLGSRIGASTMRFPSPISSEVSH